MPPCRVTAVPFVEAVSYVLMPLDGFWFLVFGCGCGCVLLQGKNLETIDLKRTARSATAGLLVHGPLCHFWIELMQTYLVSSSKAPVAYPTCRPSPLMSTVGSHAHDVRLFGRRFVESSCASLALCFVSIVYV